MQPGTQALLGKSQALAAIRRFGLIYLASPQEFMMLNNQDAKARAEAAFKRKAQQASDGAQAWEEYQANSRAVAERTERLRALRLTKEAEQANRDT
jgi:hypothetical protein